MKLERLLNLMIAIAVCFLWSAWNFLSFQDEEHAPTGFLLPSHPISRNGNVVENVTSTKPYFIFHIGPPKTATTYIQCHLHRLSKELADDDSYYYVGKTCPGASKLENNEKNIPGHFLIMGLNDATKANRGYEALKSRMDHHRMNGNNIIYSNEAFTNHLIDQNATWNCLKSMLAGWNVRVVIGYRHYFDWIRSFYYQTHKQNRNLDAMWPNQGRGRAHPSFLSFLDYHLQRKETGDLSVDGGFKNYAFGHHLTISAYNKFSPHFDDIKFLDLHDDEDIFTDFVCNILPDAEKTCNKLRTATQKEKEPQGVVKRALQSFDAHRLVEAAFDKGYISAASPKKVVVEMVNKKIEATGIDSRPEFLMCPSPTLVARLLNVSIQFENEMLEINKQGTADKAKAKSAHVSMYQKSEEDGRFCEVDPELVLKDEAWVTILSKIGEDTAGDTQGGR